MTPLRLLTCLVLIVGLLLPQFGYAQAQLINTHLVVAGHTNSCADTGSINTYSCALDRTLTQYETRACYSFLANTTNTGAATINFSSAGGSPMGAKAIVKMAGGITTPLVANDIRAGQIVTVCYDGTNMQMMSQLGNAATVANGVFTNQTNIYTTGGQDMGAATSLIVPKAAGAAPTADGDVRYDTTKDALVVGAGQGGTHAVSTVVCAASGTSTDTDDTSGTATDLDHSITCVLPANFLQLNKVLRVTVMGGFVTAAAPPTMLFKLKMSGTTVFTHGSAQTPAASGTRFGAMAWLLYTLAAPSASSAVFATQIGSDLTYFYEQQTRANATPQPVTLATNGALTVTFTTQWSADVANTHSFTMRAMVVEALN